jgi:hypothetical protein
MKVRIEYNPVSGGKKVLMEEKHKCGISGLLIKGDET